MYKIGDVYEKNEVYFIITEIVDGELSYSIPLSRWILANYIGLTEDALNIFKESIQKHETNKFLKAMKY
jgi:hypothetical protein